jgi:DNA-directed RNA polymerase specialized sigma54-like protein
MERQYGEQWNSDGDSRRATRDNRERDPKMDAMANAPSRGASLVDQLLEQWSFAEIHDPALRTAGARIIEYIDDDGLMQTPLETIREQSAHMAGCDWAIDTLKLALARIQQELEPRGVGATSVREALIIEARAYLDEETDLDGAEAALLEALELFRAADHALFAKARARKAARMAAKAAKLEKRVAATETEDSDF